MRAFKGHIGKFFCSFNCNNHCNHYNLIWLLVYTYWVITKHCGSWVWVCRFASGCLGRGCTRRPLGSLRIQTKTLCCYNLAVISLFPKYNLKYNNGLMHCVNGLCYAFRKSRGYVDEIKKIGVWYLWIGISGYAHKNAAHESQCRTWTSYALWALH